MGIENSREQTVNNRLTQAELDQLHSMITNPRITPAQQRYVEQNLRYQEKSTDLPALILGSMGQQINANELTWQGKPFASNQLQQLHSRLQNRELVTKDDLQEIFNILTMEPFTLTQMQILLDNFRFRGERLHPPQLLFGQPGFFFMPFEERLKYAKNFSWKGRQFTRDHAGNLLLKLREHYYQQSDQKIEQIMDLISHNQQVESLRYQDRPIKLPGLFFTTCHRRHLDDVTYQGCHFNPEQFKKIKSHLRKNHCYLLVNFERTMNGDIQAMEYLKKKKMVHQGKANSDDFSKMKRLMKKLRSEDIKKAQYKLTVAGTPMLSSDEVKHIVYLLRETKADSRFISEMLRWDQRQFNENQIKELLREY